MVEMARLVAEIENAADQLRPSIKSRSTESPAHANARAETGSKNMPAIVIGTTSTAWPRTSIAPQCQTEAKIKATFRTRLNPQSNRVRGREFSYRAAPGVF